MNKLRIGILTDSEQIPHWAYSMLEEIAGSSYAELVLIVRKKQEPGAKQSLLTRIRNKYKVFFYFLYLKVEKWLYKPHFDAFAMKQLSDLLPEVETMEVACIEKQFSDYLLKEDIGRIQTREIDVFIRLGFRILRGDILHAAKFGIWSYHHGDNSIYRGGPAGCWEVFQQKHVVGSVLQILSEDLDNGLVLYRSWSTVHTLQNNTLNGFFWKTSQFLPRKLKELHRVGWEQFSRELKEENEGLRFYSGRNFTVPSNREFIPLIITVCWSWFRKKLKKIFYYEQWILLYAFGKHNLRPLSIFRYHRITPPKNRYWADPCVIQKDGRYFVFYEEVVYSKNKEEGHICVMELDEEGGMLNQSVVLDKPYHLSSPSVFEYEGEYYMIPESSENSSIELYRATRFPDQWEFVKYLMEDVKAVDTTFFMKDGRCWLFTGLKRLPGTSSSEELFLFYSDSLLEGEWISHPMNPVISDVRSARPAGKLFYHEDKLYRPSQDCSVRYGYAIALNEVDLLDVEKYKEHVVTSILPEWANDVLGTHTISGDKNLYVIDALIHRRRNWFTFSKS